MVMVPPVDGGAFLATRGVMKASLHSGAWTGKYREGVAFSRFAETKIHNYDLQIFS